MSRKPSHRRSRCVSSVRLWAPLVFSPPVWSGRLHRAGSGSILPGGWEERAGGMEDRGLPWPSASFCPAFPGRGAGPHRQHGVARLRLLHRFAFCTRLFSLEKRACHGFLTVAEFQAWFFFLFFSSFGLRAAIHICLIQSTLALFCVRQQNLLFLSFFLFPRFYFSLHSSHFK